MTAGTLLVATGVARTAPGPATAESLPGAVCVLAGHEMAYPPGIGLAPSQQHIHDEGLPISCTGHLGDRQLDSTRLGTFSADVVSGSRPGLAGTGTCLSDGGEGSLTLSLPATDGGAIDVTGPGGYLALGGENRLEGDVGPTTMFRLSSRFPI
ncbi:hypothetical protein [Nocardia stercoris]|uniref:Uncharacterized protein n=1 Tax=Nocardia stercoris TaxID=2483361 RepID=A0A3M2KUG5_9NOCA|nr:hypothetical protein [Nocardia stercoris]RMI27873.1 hypothetical protein EBN03_32600 [Nocardia stercoris]